MINDVFTRDMTPEERALIARRTLYLCAKVTCLCAQGCGVTDDRIKLFLLAMRSPEIEMIADEDISVLMAELKLEEA